MSQSYPSIEIIVSDNASEDDSSAAVQALAGTNTKVIKQAQNIGMIANFNVCLDAASGRYFLMLSDDDYLAGDAIANLVAGFESPSDSLQTRDVGIVWTPATITDGSGATKWISECGPPLESGIDFVTNSFTEGRGPRFCGVLVRTDDARDVGGYQERHGPPCDVGNWSQIAVRYKAVVCTIKSYVFYTIHPSSETNATSSQLWRRSAENIVDDLLKALRILGRDEYIPRMRVAGCALVGDLLIALLSQSAGRKGWALSVAREALRSRKYIFTKHIARRFIRDAWKLTKLLK